MLLLYPFLQASISIYRRLITSESKSLVELTEPCSENEMYAASFENGATKKNALSKVFNNVVPKAWFGPFFGCFQL